MQLPLEDGEEGRNEHNLTLPGDGEVMCYIRSNIDLNYQLVIFCAKPRGTKLYKLRLKANNIVGK